MGNAKKFRPWIEAAREAGFEVLEVVLGGQHPKMRLRDPRTGLVLLRAFPGSTGDYRAVKNWTSQMRRLFAKENECSPT